MVCQRCGHEIPEDSIFCPDCGSKQKIISGQASGERETIKEPQIKEQTVASTRAPKNAKKVYLTIVLGAIAIAALIALISSSGKKDNEQSVSQVDSNTDYEEQIEVAQPDVGNSSVEELVEKPMEETISGPVLQEQVTEVTIAGTTYSTDIEALDLQNMDLTDADVTELVHLTNLEELIISDNPITNLDFVRDMKQLRKLYAVECKISDISVLANKIQLEEINLNANPVTDISPLQNCKKLRLVCFGNTNLSNLEVFSDMSELETISLYGCGLSDLSFLNIADKPNLKNLYLGGDPITSVEALRGADLNNLSLTNTLIAQNPESFEGITVNRNLEVWGCDLTEEEVRTIAVLVQGDYVLND